LKFLLVFFSEKSIIKVIKKLLKISEELLSLSSSQQVSASKILTFSAGAAISSTLASGADEKWVTKYMKVAEKLFNECNCVILLSTTDAKRGREEERTIFDKLPNISPSELEFFIDPLANSESNLDISDKLVERINAVGLKHMCTKFDSKVLHNYENEETKARIKKKKKSYTFGEIQMLMLRSVVNIIHCHRYHTIYQDSLYPNRSLTVFLSSTDRVIKYYTLLLSMMLKSGDRENCTSWLNVLIKASQGYKQKYIYCYLLSSVAIFFDDDEIMKMLWLEDGKDRNGGSDVYSKIKIPLQAEIFDLVDIDDKNKFFSCPFLFMDKATHLERQLNFLGLHTNFDEKIIDRNDENRYKLDGFNYNRSLQNKLKRKSALEFFNEAKYFIPEITTIIIDYIPF
jgi:hypothetical protein